MEKFPDELTVKLFPADIPMNAAVRLILLARGSRRLFSSYENMEKYLRPLYGAQPPFVFPTSRSTDNLLTSRELGAARCYTFTPRWVSCPRRVIYFCGGAFIRETTPQHISFVDALAAEARAEITMLCYPKAPTYTYADTYEAAARLYAELASAHGAENIVLMGDSAGASISISLCEFFSRAGLPKPGGVIAMSPVCDMTLSNPQSYGYARRDPMLGVEGTRLAIEKWCGTRRPDDPLLSPMEADVSAMPELLLYCGSEEMLCPDVRLFAEHVRARGGKALLREYKGMYHVFPLYPLKAAQNVRAEMSLWLNR